MASPTYSFCRQFVNLVPGEVEVAAKRVDADYINELAKDICRAYAIRGVYGDKAADAGSDANNCRLTLKSDSSRTGVIKSGDWFVVTWLSTGATWEGSAAADDIITFSTGGAGVDGQLYEGVAPGDYSAPAFIQDLRIEIRHTRKQSIQKQELNLTDGGHGSFQSDDLLRPGGGVLETELAADEAAFAAAHDGATGAHKPGVIEEDDFADDAFENFNYDNLLANGGAELGPGGAGESGVGVATGGPPFYWAAVAGREPNAISHIPTDVYEGRMCCEIGFTAANQAVDLAFDPIEFDVTQHRGKYVALTVAVRAANADSIQVGFNGAVGGESLSAAGGTAGVYTILTHVMQIDGGETGLTARVNNTFAGANTTQADAAIAVLGSKPVGYKRSTWEVDALKARYGSIYDLALNGYFSHWTNGAAAEPDCWELVGTATCIQEAAAANVARGDYSAEVVLPDDTAIFRQRLGWAPTNKLTEILRSRYITAKFKVKWKAGTRNLHATLCSDVGGNTKKEVIDLPSAGNFITCAVIALQIDATATDVWLEFANLDAGAGQIEFYLDDVQITPSPWPCAPLIPNYWEIEIMEWTYSGALDPSVADVDLFKGMVNAFTTNLGVQAGFYGVPLRAYVECNVAPAVATTFELRQNGAGIESIGIDNPATESQIHINLPGAWNRITPSDNLQVTAAAGGSTVEDVVVRWVFLKSAADGSEI